MAGDKEKLATLRTSAGLERVGQDLYSFSKLGERIIIPRTLSPEPPDEVGVGIAGMPITTVIALGGLSQGVPRYSSRYGDPSDITSRGAPRTDSSSSSATTWPTCSSDRLTNSGSSRRALPSRDRHSRRRLRLGCPQLGGSVPAATPPNIPLPSRSIVSITKPLMEDTSEHSLVMPCRRNPQSVPALTGRSCP